MANIGNHTFIDGVGEIRLQDGVIRMDLLALSPTQRDKEGNPVPQFVEQLVMSPVAFGRMVQAMGKTIRQAQEQGLIPQLLQKMNVDPGSFSAAVAEKLSALPRVSGSGRDPA